MSPPVPAGAAAPRAERVERLADRLVRAARRTRRREDDEAIHDTRVALRRLDATLDVWRDALPPARRRRARRSLRRLRRSLSPAREAEVNAELLRTRLAASGTPPALDLAAALARLERRADRARRRAARACGRAALARLARRVERAWRPLHAGLPVVGEALAAARGRAGHRAAVARAALAEAARRGDAETLHRARIALKRWRYGLEALGGVEAGMAGAPPAALEQVQDSLGVLHDLAILRATLLEFLHATAPQPLKLDQPLAATIAELDREYRLELIGLTDRAAAVAVPPGAVSKPGAFAAPF